MKAWSEIRTRRFALALLIAAGMFCAVATVSVEPAAARTRIGVEMGDPDIGNEKPGTGPSRLAAPVNYTGKASQPLIGEATAARSISTHRTWLWRLAPVWAVVRLVLGR